MKDTKSEYVANKEGFVSGCPSAKHGDVMDEREPLVFDDTKRPKLGNPEDNSTWAVLPN